MRLRTVKLSGFKSFVDPTTLAVPGNLVGIVGPNGCGKSNIIDAVMWVMGESSAKHLRGDSLTDVIFNGSSARNPVGQASVELVFDNTENKLGGQYASYDEISIKRQITRDAISTYYLNGTRCRRRDIQSIFLGTGLGPRSYAIIEQGMISRLIEAKPDELRVFIEEAAGISKYRERRRETENRIRNTKENIARLNDIREELGKQLKHLQRQSRAAERYQELKKEQRNLESELHALNWKSLNQQSLKEEDDARKQETSVEAGMAELRQLEAAIEKLRDKLSSANEAFNSTQSDYYGIGGEISQLEQKIQHTNERISTTEHDLVRARQEMTTAQEQFKQDQARLKELSVTKEKLEPQLLGSRNESDQAYSLLNQSEQAMQAWQTEWETFNESVAKYTRDKDVGNTRIEHLELSIEEAEQRREVLQDELESIDQDTLKSEIASQTRLVKEAEQLFEKRIAEQNSIQADIQKARAGVQRDQDILNEHRLKQQKLEGRLASLIALQESAQGEDQPEIKKWLDENKLQKNIRLAQQINVEPEWIHAVDFVLDRFLQDICVDNITGLTGKLDRIKEGTIGIIESDKSIQVKSSSRFPSLADKIKGPFPLKHILATVFIANDSASAVKMRTNLEGNESVITRDGFWIGLNWTRVSRGESEKSGMLIREQEIKKIRQELDNSGKDLQKLEGEIKQNLKRLALAEEKLDESQAVIQEQQGILSEHRTVLVSNQTRMSQAGSRIDRINEELQGLEEQIQEDRNELESLQIEIEQVSASKNELESQRIELNSQRDKFRDSLNQARERWQKTHEQSHGIALQLESISSQRASLEQSIKRADVQIKLLQSRCEELDKSLAENKSPVGDMQGQLKVKLQQKVDAEKKLADARTHVQEIENSIRDMEQTRHRHEQNIQELRDTLEQARLLVRESRVRLQTIEEKLKESGQIVNDILARLEDDANPDEWRENLDNVIKKIQRLGPINLAAIDEYSQLSERKSYLDSQDEDLREALKTLENAIRKIDKESRSRFKETFDQLNSNLQEMFPQLFGGGNAYLELTGDDLLETGVTIMARPPGKRNTTIHLLSGGEKALTAVALVFAIFKLNPAPFCILDEVDAPLDDANVVRYSELLSAMSEDVQFIFITHNKITMEIAHQLLGVTMQEAGVSRLVTVDVQEAVEMAATA